MGVRRTLIAPPASPLMDQKNWVRSATLTGRAGEKQKGTPLRNEIEAGDASYSLLARNADKSVTGRCCGQKKAPPKRGL